MQFTNDNVSLLNKKDLEFLYNYETEINNIETKLNLQRNKKEKVLSILSRSMDVVKVSGILALIDENVALLTSLKNDLLSLNEFIVNFMIKLNSTNNSESEEIKILQSKINDVSAISANAENKVFINDVKIDTFINTTSKVQDADLPKTTETVALSGEESIADNNTLLISEKKKTVFLPYTKKDLQKYYKQFPKSYKNLKDVVQKQFILPVEYYKNFSVSRFREGYSLMRNREGKSILDSLKFGIRLMFKSSLHPAIITACKTEDDLKEYLECLENNKLKDFRKFIIKFEVAPLKALFTTNYIK